MIKYRVLQPVTIGGSLLQKGERIESKTPLSQLEAEGHIQRVISLKVQNVVLPGATQSLKRK